MIELHCSSPTFVHVDNDKSHRDVPLNSSDFVSMLDDPDECHLSYPMDYLHDDDVDVTEYYVLSYDPVPNDSTAHLYHFH